jgi:hypothetical protein
MRATLVLALIGCAAPALAADHPDLSGFWNLAMTPGFNDPKSFDPELKAKLPPNTVILTDSGVAEYPKGEFGGLKLKPEARVAAEKWQPEDEMTLSRVCAAPSTVYAQQGPFPFEVVQTPQLIVFKYEYFDQVRLIFLDGRGHLPPDAPHSKVGDSIGHWEGDELVVDTTHFSAATITNNGLDHSENVHLVERYKLSPDGKSLTATQWFEDPDVLDNNGARFIQWKKFPGQHVYPYDCDPSIATEYGALGKAPN